MWEQTLQRNDKDTYHPDTIFIMWRKCEVFEIIPNLPSYTASKEEKLRQKVKVKVLVKHNLKKKQ